MAIIQQPALSPLAAYSGEAYFKFQDVILSTLGKWKQAVITVTNITTGEAVTVRKAPDALTPSGGNTIGDFSIDVSNIIQTYFCTDDKRDVLTILNGFAAPIEQNQPVFRLDVGYEYVATATGLVTASLTTDTTNDFTVLNTTFANDALPFLINYTAASNRLFLTRAPRNNKVCLDDNAVLTFWIDGINALRIGETPKGGPLQTGIIDISGLITSGTIQDAQVGPVAINAATYASGTVTIDNNTNFYTVEAGQFALGVFTPVTEAFTFTLVDCCPQVDCRLYWLNSLGGIDSYLFNGNKQVFDVAESARYEKPLAIPRVLLDNGPGKFDSRRTTRTVLTSKFLCGTEPEWLRELQSSIVVCKQLDVLGTLRGSPVVVVDSETLIEDRDATGILKVITFIDADPVEVQQYG